MRAWSAGALALELEPSPRSARQARRWITDLCRKHGREDLVESAETGVSELVSNALIHAPGPLSVRLSGTPAHPRVEVADSSSQPPRPQPAAVLEAGTGDAETPDVTDDLLDALLDDLSLLTYGRGLRIVAAGSVAWGAEVRRDGKVVWFEPAPELRAELSDAEVAGVVHLPDETTPQPPTDGLGIRLPGVPVAAFARFRHHYRELRRELRLLALAHAEDYPQAGRLSALLADFDRSLGRAIDDDAPLTALAERRRYAEVSVRVDADPEALAQAADTMQRLLDLADEFCSSVRLLTPARTPEQRRFTQWFLTSLARRAAGMPAEPWERAPGTPGVAGYSGS